jgi:hypothetical protein
MSHTSRLVIAVTGISCVAVAAWGQRQYTISTVVGSSLLVGAAATKAYIPIPVAIATDTSGGFYFSGQYSNQIIHVNSGGTIDSVIGKRPGGFGGDGGPASGASVAFNYVTGLAVDASGDLYVVDNGNYRVRKMMADPQLAPTLSPGH